MTYREACETVGKEPSSPARQEPAVTPPKPPADEWLSLPWQKAAWAFLERCREDLKRCSGAVAYLQSRGLKDETISSLGLNDSTAHVDRAVWGLPPETDAKTRRLRRLWLPRGIVIPALDGKLIHRLRIRLSPEEVERSKMWTAGGKGIRYIEVSGSGSYPLFLPGKGEEAWAVVESELDAYLVHQETDINVLGLGSTTGKPTAQMLKDMAGKRVLLCLDHDAAGWRALGNLPGEYWPVPDGKDPGEYFQAGGNIRAWIELGLKLNIPPEESVQPEPLHEAEESVQDDIPGEIEKSSLPCNKPGFRCYHLRGGQCFYKSNWGPGSELGTCPMIEGQGYGDAHPAITEIERYRQGINDRRKRCLECEWAWWEDGAHVCMKQDDMQVDRAMRTCPLRLSQRMDNETERPR